MADTLRRRTRIEFKAVNKEADFVRILIPEWNDTQTVRLYWSKLPNEIRGAAKEGLVCTAKVNVDPQNKAAELLYEAWEIVDE